MDEIWPRFKKCLGMPKLLKTSASEVILERGLDGIRALSTDKRRVITSTLDGSSYGIDAGIQYSIPYDHPMFNESEVNTWSLSPKKESLRLDLKLVGGHKNSDFRKKAIPFRFEDKLDYVLLSSVSKSDFLYVLDSLEVSANVKDTKTEDEARINALFFRQGDAFTINRHMASVVDFKSTMNWSIPSLDFAVVRGFVDRLSSESIVYIYKSEEYLKIQQDNTTLYLQRLLSKEPGFTSPDGVYDYEFQVNSSVLKSYVKWSDYNADASSYFIFEFEGNKCSIKTKYKDLGEFEGIVGNGKFSANLPNKLLVNTIEYLHAGVVRMRFGHSKHPTIFNMSQVNPDNSLERNIYLQTVKL